MKIKNYRTIVIVGLTAFLALSLIIVGVFLTGGANQSPFFSSKVRAASLTYKRDLKLLADAGTITPTSIVTPTDTASASPTFSPSPTLASSSALLTNTPTATPEAIATDIISPTPLKSLPRTGWTQNVSIMFITASVLMFVSFIF